MLLLQVIKEKKTVCRSSLTEVSNTLALSSLNFWVMLGVRVKVMVRVRVKVKVSVSVRVSVRVRVSVSVRASLPSPSTSP